MLARLVALILAGAAATAAVAHETSSSEQRIATVSGVARDATAVVDAFHAALRRGDTKGASLLLTDDALIYEAGGVERSKAEYSASHLPADAEYAQAVKSVVTGRAGGSDGKLAWIASEGRTTGTFRGKAVDRKTVETMLLRQVGNGWKITHIHWSSAAVPAAVAATAVPLLAGSTPANGSVVNGPVEALELRFSPAARLLEVVVTGPDGQIPMMVTAAGEQARYSLPLPSLQSGNYSVDWRATAAGRQDQGTFGFTVK